MLFIRKNKSIFLVYLVELSRLNFAVLIFTLSVTSKSTVMLDTDLFGVNFPHQILLKFSQSETYSLSKHPVHRI